LRQSKEISRTCGTASSSAPRAKARLMELV
jgi:hypothetical protein